MRYMNNYNEAFIDTIRKIRVQRGLTQEELASIAGINEKHYGRIERGECSTTINYFFYICSALEIRPDKFFEYMFKKDSE